jgi:hypothetical protein
MTDRDGAERTARQALTPDRVARAYRTASETSLQAAVAGLTEPAQLPSNPAC